MIAKFISKIEIDTNSFKKEPVHRNYYVEENNKKIATGWVKDLTYWHLGSLKNQQDREGKFSYNGKEYHIGSDVRWGSEWPFYDENNTKVMSLWDDTEKVEVEVKKLFSKKKVLKKRVIAFQRIITASNSEYIVYYGSLGKEGDYYTIYKEGNVVSEIIVSIHNHNYGRNMDIYAEDDPEIILVTFLYCFLLAMYSYYHTDSTIIHESGNYNSISTKSKDYELAKFSMEFIEKIKSKNNNS